MTERIPSNISEILFDVIIIGAGINGAGIARDASMRGLKVLLMDKADIASGTSSASTRLIHGGLRYLEHGELGLVRESLREREILFRIAPHLVKPLPILIPIYDAAKRGPFSIRAGMLAYDLLSFDKSLPWHQMLSRAEALSESPGLNPQGLRSAAIYFDAQVEFAERLVVENVLSATENGATVITYAKFRQFIIEDGVVRGVEFNDVLGGGAFAARGRIVVNATGPWIDHILEKLPTPSDRLIGGTKGSHIIVAPFEGAPRSALYTEAHTDGRPFFIIPWNGNYLIGTTDIRYEGDLDKIEIEADEAEYLLQETNKVISTAALSRDSIIYTYSGVRPLAYVSNTDEQSITRRHFIREHKRVAGVISVVGGKLTTYRSLAQQTVDLVFKRLRRAAPGCTTREVPLPGAVTSDFAAFCEQFKSESDLPGATSERLLRIYGTRAIEVLGLAAQDALLRQPFDEQTGALAAEVVFSFEHELAQTLTDCLLRRTMVGLNSSAGIGADETTAAVAQKHLGWSANRVAQEVAAFRGHCRRFRPRIAQVEER